MIEILSLVLGIIVGYLIGDWTHENRKIDLDTIFLPGNESPGSSK